MKQLPILLISVLLSTNSASRAGQMGHFMPGVMGVRDHFQPPEAGFYYSQGNFAYFSGEFNDGNGDALDSMTLSRSRDVSRTFSGSRDFGFSKTRRSNFAFDYQGNTLDLGAKVDTATSASVSASLSAEARAHVHADVTVRAHLDDFDLSIKGILPTLVWKSDTKLFGATIGALMTFPIVDLDIDAEVSGHADIHANLDGELTVRALATLTGSTTTDGTLTVTGPNGTVFQKGGNRTFTHTLTKSGKLVRNFSAEKNVGRDFKLSIHKSIITPGDIYVQPLWLDWSRDHFEVSLSDGFYAPTGHYEVGAIDNTGYGMWTNQARLAAALYPFKSHATVLAAAATYEVHGEKEGTNITPGQNLTLNWGISQIIPLNSKQTVLADIGFLGYDVFQVSDDRGRGVTYDASVHDTVHAYGVALGLIHTKWKAGLSMRWLHEYSSRDRFRGDMFVVGFNKKF